MPRDSLVKSTKSGKNRNRDEVSKRKAAATAPYKQTRKRLYRRTSSAHGENQTPTFQQPGTCTDHRVDEIEEGDGDRESEEDEEDDDDDDDSAVDNNGNLLKTKYLKRLPGAERYRALGKAFALKYAPWPCESWWLGVDATIEDALRGQLGEWEKEKKEAFVWYVAAVGIPEEVWATPQFTTQVIPVRVPLRCCRQQLVKSFRLGRGHSAPRLLHY